MGTYTAADGTHFTEADIEHWAAVTESEEGYTGDHRGPTTAGRPVSIGADARPFTLRLDAQRRAKLRRIAEQRQVTTSQLMRELIDSL